MAPARSGSSSAESSPEPSQNSMHIPHRPHNPHKRRRSTQTAGGQSSRRRTASPEPDHDFGYDPDQPIAERRRLQKDLRSLQNEVQDRADELVQPTSTELGDVIAKADQLSLSVKQTSEALYDSRLLLQVSQLVTRKTQNLTKGGMVQGLDLDGFISKSVVYMRHGRGLDEDDAPQLSSTQRQRRVDDDDEVGDDGDMLRWDHYGQFGCLPHISRPCLPGFLIGPLSVEKKVRRITQRAARFRPNDLQEVKPQLIQKEDLGRNEKNDLAVTCRKVLERLGEYVESCQEEVEAASEADAGSVMDRLGLHPRGDIDLFRFAINPHSFGQTVENLFYISFLIRDRRVEVDFTEDGFATIFPYEKDGGGSDDDDEADDVPSQGQKARHQAVFTIDMDIWRDAVEAFGITESIIPHREENADHAPGAKGWYG